MTSAELTQWRTARNLTLVQVGELLGVTAATVSRWESGHRKIPAFLWRALAHLDATDLAHRLPGDEAPRPDGDLGAGAGGERRPTPWATLGARLRAAREAAHLQQVTVAVRLGVHPSAITLFERGAARPSRARIGRYAALVGVDLDELLALGEYPPPDTPPA